MSHINFFVILLKYLNWYRTYAHSSLEIVVCLCVIIMFSKWMFDARTHAQNERERERGGCRAKDMSTLSHVKRNVLPKNWFVRERETPLTSISVIKYWHINICVFFLWALHPPLLHSTVMCSACASSELFLHVVHFLIYQWAHTITRTQTDL